MSEIMLKPWIGKNYETGGIFGKKILALGESCYWGDDEDVIELDEPIEFATQVVEDYLNPNHPFAKWKNTYKKFERALVGKETTNEDSHEIWNSIAFYNYLQFIIRNPRQPVLPELYEKSEKAFFEVLEMLKPDLVVCWGAGRLYNSMPEKNWKKQPVKDVDGYGVKNGKYLLSDGTEITTIWIYHPSAPFDWSYWHKVIKAF